jgi:hypothetical protein
LDTIKNELKIQNIVDLKNDTVLRDLIGELWAEIEWFVETTGTSKFFENAYGVGFRRTFQIQQQVAAFPFPFPLPPQQPPAPVPAAPAPAAPGPPAVPPKPATPATP